MGGVCAVRGWCNWFVSDISHRQMPSISFILKVLGPVTVSTTSPSMYTADSVVKMYTEVVASVSFYIHSTIVSGSGSTAGRVLWEKSSVTQSPGNGTSSLSVTVFQQTDLLANLPLWDVDSPQLHTLISRVVRSDDGKVTDELNTTFGVRKVHLDVDYGLFLNDRRYNFELCMRACMPLPFRLDETKYESLPVSLCACSAYPSGPPFAQQT